MPSQRWSRSPCSTAFHCACFAKNSATCASSPSGWSGNPKIGYAKSLMDYIARWLELRFLAGDQGELFKALPIPIQPAMDAKVLMNLIINGIDAMKEVEGLRELAIDSQQAENRLLVVSITDTGVGLPAQHADQIFDAFFTTKVYGTGMGLRISRSIVEAHGGRLWAGPNSPRGASFHFSLPTKTGGYP